MRARSLGQNFLRDERTASRLVQLADGPPDALCVDLGAGKGIVTDAALARRGPVLAIEVDRRLADLLERRFAAEPRVTIRHADVLTVPVPLEPFVVAANPPFNTSTALIRRWLLAEMFQSGALVVEKTFARRVSGWYGTTKLSLSLAPYLELAMPVSLSAADFSPRPNVPTVVLTAIRRQEPLLARSESGQFWLFINYLFERGSRTVGESLRPLRLRGLAAALRTRQLRDLTPESAVTLYVESIRVNANAMRAIDQFNKRLPSKRRSALDFRPA